MYIGVPALGSVGQLPVGPACFWCVLLAVMHTPGLLQLHVLARTCCRPAFGRGQCSIAPHGREVFVGLHDWIVRVWMTCMERK